MLMHIHTHTYLLFLSVTFIFFSNTSVMANTTISKIQHIKGSYALQSCAFTIYLRAHLQTELLITLDKARKNIVTTRILGSQPLISKLITSLGQLAMHCLQIYRLKDATYLIQLLKHFANTALSTLKHFTLIHVVYTVAQVLAALCNNSKQLRKDIHQLIKAYRQDNYYALGKALVYTTKTLAGRTLAHKILRTSFKIARIQNLNAQYTKALLSGVKHALHFQKTKHTYKHKYL